MSLARTILVAVLVLFPYFLFRFATSFRPAPRWLGRLAAGLTAATSLGAFAIGRFPEAGAPQPARIRAYILLLLVQWVVLSTVVAVRLWRGGSGEPTIARRRMRLLSVGALGFALTLVFAASASSTEVVTLRRLIVQILGLLCAPLFLVGAAPPGFLRAAWRRPEVNELFQAERRLMTAESPSEVADSLLQHAAHILGSRAAVLIQDGGVIGRFGISEPDAASLAARGVVAAELDPSAMWIPMDRGWLAVLGSPYTPYFGQDEADLLKGLALLADLALSRTDLMQRERAGAQALQAANESLVATNEAIKEFVAIASHDLRTPITVIQGFASTITEQWESMADEDKKRHTATIDRQADQLSRLVNDLLVVSQIEAHALQPNTEAVRMEHIVARSIEGLGERRADVRVNVPGDLMVRADPEHLLRILGNYITNAFSYGRPPVEVEARREGSIVEVRVIDHGDGVPEEFRPRLFEKFARADKRMSKASNGTGLGLSIVRGLARAEEGDAWYEPSKDGGACFVVRLMVAP